MSELWLGMHSRTFHLYCISVMEAVDTYFNPKSQLAMELAALFSLIKMTGYITFHLSMCSWNFILIVFIMRF